MVWEDHGGGGAWGPIVHGRLLNPKSDCHTCTMAYKNTGTSTGRSWKCELWWKNHLFLMIWDLSGIYFPHNFQDICHILPLQSHHSWIYRIMTSDTECHIKSGGQCTLRILARTGNCNTRHILAYMKGYTYIWTNVWLVASLNTVFPEHLLIYNINMQA